MGDVINIKDLDRRPAAWPARCQYIGRTHSNLGLLANIWSNPYKIGEHGDREQVLEQYEDYLRRMLFAKPGVRRQLRALLDKTLVCWCKPERCHGDILLVVAALNDGEYAVWMAGKSVIPSIAPAEGEQMRLFEQGFTPGGEG
jgi:hypothetical protein